MAAVKSPAMRALAPGLMCLVVLAGCGSWGARESAPGSPAESAAAPLPGKGAYYKDDGPGAHPPPELAAIPDAVPRAEPLHRFANRPYQVFGKDYVPLTRSVPFRQAGIASWYGRRYHGSATSSGEKYDMYAMTAAHPTLPIPSYVRVTNPANGRSVVVRVNDRGPFHADRIIDLSYTAAWKLGYVEAGSARVEVEGIAPGAAPPPPAAAAAASPARADGETKGFVVQLGAFSAAESAENFRARVYRELAWLSEAIAVVPGGNLYRLHLGPYRSQEDARSMADRIQSELGLRPVVVGR
jgi:rare lipoprotein A